MMFGSFHQVKTRLMQTKPYVIFLAFFGTLLIIIGLVCYLSVFHSLINRIISERLIISEGSEMFEKWKQIPMPIYYQYYFFNVSNPLDIERSGAKPRIKEIGPFTYRSKWSKNSIKFNQNDTVTFREYKSLEFVPELSYGSDTERILTTVNGPLAVTLALLQKAPLVVRNIVSLGLSTITEGFFIKRSARELLFDGYPEVLTSFGPLLNPSIPNTKGRFGWLYGRNNTDDGLFTVFTGKNNLAKINQVDRYNGLNEISYWKKRSRCSRLDGTTDGQIIALGRDRSFHLFHPELCRTIRFIPIELALNSSNFISKTLDNNQIKFTVDRFTPDSNVLSSWDDYGGNSCYLSKLTPPRPELGDLLVNIRQRNQNQSKFSIKPFMRIKNGRIFFRSGVFDMSQCKYGAPVLFSYPHFLYAHPNYRENIGGMKPNESRHRFEMLIEPITGTSIRSYARIQINIYISKPPWISRFRNIPEIVFPVFWQELRAEATMDIIERINWALTKPFLYADIASYVIIVIGLLLVFLSGCFMLKNNFKSTQEKVTKSAKNNTIVEGKLHLEEYINNSIRLKSSNKNGINVGVINRENNGDSFQQISDIK
uniref:Scavenger receptor class B member 1 n=1 Tax=Sarcoptes scabiei TaxID=52283 RepID=A0A834VJC1_SARSC